MMDLVFALIAVLPFFWAEFTAHLAEYITRDFLISMFELIYIQTSTADRTHKAATVHHSAK
jgi:hypothetical protein